MRLAGQAAGTGEERKRRRPDRVGVNADAEDAEFAEKTPRTQAHTPCLAHAAEGRKKASEARRKRWKEKREPGVRS